MHAAIIARNVQFSLHGGCSSLGDNQPAATELFSSHPCSVTGKNAENQSSQSLVILAQHRTTEGMFFCQPVTAHRMDRKE
jgi:hypothetical protein